MSSYIPYTQEERDRAHRTDLIALLRSQGEMLKRSGTEYEWRVGGQHAMQLELIQDSQTRTSLGMIERRLTELENQFQHLLELAADDSAAYHAQFKEILDEQTALKQKRSGLEANMQVQNENRRRITATQDALADLSPRITEWDELAIRQLVDTVKVISKEEILVTLKSGDEIRQKIVIE